MINYDLMLKRVNNGKSQKQLWESTLREVMRYCMPNKETINTTTTGSDKTEYVYDSTGQNSLESYAVSMQSDLSPTNGKWVKLLSGTEVPKEQIEDVNKYLEESTDILFGHINSSNFASQIHEAYLDLGIGTGAIIVEAGDGIQSSLNFRAIPLSELIIERSLKGTIDTVWRELTISAMDLPVMFPTAIIPDDIARMIREGNAADINLIEGVVYVEGGYESVLMYPTKSMYLIQKEVESSPWIVFRSSVSSGESYGRGPAIRALSDIKTLNLMVKDHLQAASFTANPVFTASDDGVINPYTITLEPGTIIPVGSNTNDNPTLRPLPIAGNYNVLQYDIEKLQATIKETFLGPSFGNIEETPVRSASEIIIRNNNAVKMSASASGRIQSELIQALIARCIYVLKSVGKIADFKVNGKQVAIKSTTPNSKIHDEEELAGITRFMELMAGLPEEVVRATVKIEEIPQKIGDIIGVSATLFRSDTEKQEIAQAQQAQAQGEEV